MCGHSHADACACQVQHTPQTLLSISLQNFSSKHLCFSLATFLSPDMTVSPLPSPTFSASFYTTWLWRQDTKIVISVHSSIYILYRDFLMLKISYVCLFHPIYFPDYREEAIGKLSIGLSLHFVVFAFILFQYDLQIMSLPDSSYSCSVALPQQNSGTLYLYTDIWVVGFLCLSVCV